MPDITTYQKAMANIMSRKINDDLEKAIPPIDVDWIRKYAGKEKVFIEIGKKKIEVGEIHAIICQKVIEEIAVGYYKELAESVDESVDEKWNNPNDPPPIDKKYNSLNCSIDVYVEKEDRTISVGWYDYDKKSWQDSGGEYTTIIGWRSIT